MAVKYLDNAGTQYLVNKIKAIDGKIPTESQITTMITTALNTYKEGIVTIVESLPQTGEEGKLYLLVDPSDSDVYIIYTWEENAFKRMGSKTFTLTVDSALSATSTNPVQNKVIKSALDGKANSSHTHGSITNDGKLATASKVVITGTDKKIGVSTVTTTELGYLSGVTSAIQTQLNGKSATGHTHTAGDVAGLATVATSGSYNDLSNKPSIPIKISDLQDDVDMLTSHEDLHLENLPNDSPNIRFINNSPQITWNDYVYHDPATTLISGPSYEFDDESSLTSKSKIGYTNSSNSQNTIEHIYGQTYGTTKAFFTMKYYYGSNEKNDEEDESCTINSSLVFTLDPNYYSAGADTYYDESNAYSDVSPNNGNYFLGGYRPFKEIYANNFMLVGDGYMYSLVDVLSDIGSSLGPHLEDTDIHVTASDKTTWNAVTSKANDSDVVHKSGNETVGGVKTFSDNPVIGNNNTNITISNRQITANSSYSAPTGSSYSFMQLKAIVNYADSSPSIAATVGLSIQENAYDDGRRAGFSPSSNNTTDLGLTGKRWANVYATNYYYGGSEIEFSTKFVTTDTSQTIAGLKTFANNTMVVGRNTDGNSAIQLINSDAVGDSANGSSGFEVYGSSISDDNKIGGLTVGEYSNNGGAYATIEVNRTVSDVKTSNRIRNLIRNDGSKEFSAGIDNDCKLGHPYFRWSEVYATNYYYGSNNVEFSTKFVTTDTNQTISGGKTFSSPTRIYNASATVQADVPSLVFKNSLVERASTTLDGEQTILFTDKNDNNIGSIQAKTYTSGISDIILTSYSEYDGVKTTGIMIRRTPTTSKLQGYSDNITDLGDTNRRWRRVYATNYYYGSNNVEFSDKFITTDTNQTISGNKTFSSDLTVANIDTTSNTPNLNLRNYKLDRGTTDTGVQTITFLDKNAKALTLIESRRTSNGTTGTNILCYNTDDSNNTVSGGVSILKSKNDTSFAPNTDNAVNCGRALAKWSDVQTYKVNALEPSSLSLPSDRSARVDISSYITNLGNGDNNQYIVPANGYIWLHFTSINSALCYSQTPGGLTNYAQTFVRYSGDGQLYAFFPVRKDDYFIVQIYTSSTAVVQNAYFIPCQGNV